MPMTTSEIRALLLDAHDDINQNFHPERDVTVRLCNAIETLLAREAEVLKAVPDEPLRNPQNPNETELAIWRERNEIRRAIRAILNPENET